MSAHSHHPQHGQGQAYKDEANQMIEKYDKNGDSVLTKNELTTLIMEQSSQHRGPHKDDVVCKPHKAPAKPKPKEEKGSKMRLSRSQIKEIFEEHDIDGDGCLNMSEMTKAFSFCGSVVPFHKAHYGLSYADEDGDGLISEEELEKLIDYAERVSKKKGGF